MSLESRGDVSGAAAAVAAASGIGGDPPPTLRHGSDLVPPLLERLLQDGIGVRFEVDGHSMTPFIRRGDLVTVRPRGDRRPPIGAVLVVAVDRQRLLVHRHVGWAEDGLVARGDCAMAPDPPAPLDRVVGIVTQVERRGRRALAGLGPGGRAIACLSRLGLFRLLARLF